ncbi:MAG: AAA family ATPase [Clostridiales bacterium]|nr:AAA family ATPase [Clostridiales bacterium]
MNKPHGIIVFGANGSGKTTLARELARILNFKHMDIEEYCFKESKIPYTTKRTPKEYEKLMLTDIEKHGSFVLSAVTGNFGDIIPKFYELAVYISAPLELRIERIKQRQSRRFGERVQKGGDMYKQTLDFLNFVESRSITRIEQWVETLVCPIIHIDGTKDWRENAVNIANKYYEKTN